MATTLSSPEPVRRLLRLLIVEDSPADAELMVATLKRAGFPLTFDVVGQCADFHQALARTNYDLILCDHNLGTWQGFEALEIVRKSGKAPPFIVVTATLGDEAAVDYVKQGAADYVLKHRLQRLPVAVRQALRDKAHRDEATRLHEQILAGKREWELTFDSVPDPILLLSPSGGIIRANRSVVELAQKQFPEIIGRACWDVMPCGEQGPERCPHLKTMESGAFTRRDTLVRVKGQSFECTANPLRDPEGNLSGSVVVLHDLTERRRAEEELRQSEERFRTAFHASPEPLTIARLDDGRYVDVNEAFLSSVGFTREEVMGHTGAELGIWVDSLLRTGLIRQLQSGQPIRDQEVQVRGKNGEVRWSMLAGEVIEVSGERCVLFMGRDITERKQAEQDLRESEERFRQLAENIEEVFYIEGPEGSLIEYVSPAYEKVWGRPRESVYSEPLSWLESVHPDDLSRLRKLFEGRIRTGEPIDCEFRIRRPDGTERWIWDRSFAVKDDQGHVRRFVGFAADITARKKAESQLADQLEELRRWHKATLNREDRILDLKREVNEALRLSGQPPRYANAEREAA
ncbi:MAG: PAS domain S-box protein [Terriglobia bacterium]